jgi:hypothetical protein
LFLGVLQVLLRAWLQARVWEPAAHDWHYDLQRAVRCAAVCLPEHVALKGLPEQGALMGLPEQGVLMGLPEQGDHYLHSDCMDSRFYLSDLMVSD